MSRWIRPSDLAPAQKQALSQAIQEYNRADTTNKVGLVNLDAEDSDSKISMRAIGEGDDQHVIVELKSKIVELGKPTRYSTATYDLTRDGLTRLIQYSKKDKSSVKYLAGGSNPIVAKTFEAFQKVFVGVPEYYPTPKSGEAVASRKKTAPSGDAGRKEVWAAADPVNDVKKKSATPSMPTPSTPDKLKVTPPPKPSTSPI